VWNIRIGKDCLIDAMAANQIIQLFFWMNGNTLWVQRPRQRRRILSTLDVGDLCRSERNDLILWVVAERDVKVVKIAPGSTQYDDTSRVLPAPIHIQSGNALSDVSSLVILVTHQKDP
jgi:hypothetical protein